MCVVCRDGGERVESVSLWFIGAVYGECVVVGSERTTKTGLFLLKKSGLTAGDAKRSDSKSAAQTRRTEDFICIRIPFLVCVCVAWVEEGGEKDGDGGGGSGQPTCKTTSAPSLVVFG